MSKTGNKSYPLFDLGEAYKLGEEMGLEIAETIIGRLANTPVNMGILAQMIFYAGDGDHLEIGTLFGGSAILAARIKQHYDLCGQIVCVDPLDGWYGQAIDPQSGVRVNPDTVRENALNFDVKERIEICPVHSDPWPFNKRKRFKSAYIDGNHVYSGCLSDWENCRRQVTDFIVFDNYDRIHDGVVKVVLEAICSPRWIPVHVNDVSVVLAKKTRMREWIPDPE